MSINGVEKHTITNIKRRFCMNQVLCLFMSTSEYFCIYTHIYIYIYIYVSI